MPTLTWTIQIEDKAALADLTKIEQVANRAREAVAGIGRGAGAPGGGTAAASSAAGVINPTAVANSQAALTRVGTQVDALQRRLVQLASANPSLRVNTNFTQVATQAAALQTTLRDIAEQSRALPAGRVRLDTAEARAQLAALQRAAVALQAQYGPASASVQRFGQAHQTAAGQTHGLLDSIKGIGIGLLVYSGFAKAEALVSHFAEAVIALPAAFEQAQIGFTAMLGGSRAAADALLAKLQALANVTPFKFTGEQSAARELLGLGQQAEKVLPELVDIDTAVAAVGGNEDQVLAVAAALGKMSAEGRVSAIFMNELTRNGIPAWVMLAESMGKSVAEVRALSESGELASSVFERAFHTYTVTHWGDALAAQSQTFAGLISTAQDLGEQFLRVFGMPIIQELEPKLRGALAALQDPKVLATITEWGQKAAEFVGWLFEGVGALGQMLGLPTLDLTTNMVNASDAVKQFAGDWSTVPASIAASTDAAAGFARETAHAQYQIDRLRAAQEQADTAATNAINAQRAAQTEDDDRASAVLNNLRDAQASQDRIYDSQLERLHAIGDQLERNHQIAKQERDVAKLRADIAHDESRARNIFTASGQAAAKRLEDERARLADLQDEQDYQNKRAAIQAKVGNVEGRKRTTDQTAQDSITALERARAALDQSYGSIITGIERRRTSDDQATANAIRNLQAIIDADKRLKEALDKPDLGITAATNAYKQFYDSTLPGVAAGAQPQIVGALATLGTDVGKKIGDGLTDWINNDLPPLIDKWAPKLQEIGGKIADVMIGAITDAFTHLDWGKLIWTNVSNFSPPAAAFHFAAGATGITNAGITGIGDTSGPVNTKPVPPGTPQLGPNQTAWFDFGDIHIPLFTRGNGGPVSAGQPYIVGEYGQEWFVPNQNGYILPNQSPPPAPSGAMQHNLTVTVRTERGEVLGIVNTALESGGAQIARALGQHMRGQR